MKECTTDSCTCSIQLFSKHGMAWSTTKFGSSPCSMIPHSETLQKMHTQGVTSLTRMYACSFHMLFRWLCRPLGTFRWLRPVHFQWLVISDLASIKDISIPASGHAHTMVLLTAVPTQRRPSLFLPFHAHTTSLDK